MKNLSLVLFNGINEVVKKSLKDEGLTQPSDDYLMLGDDQLQQLNAEIGQCADNLAAIIKLFKK